MSSHINIIGVGGSIHDFSSCLLQDGKMVMCIEDERIVRKKHAFYEGASYDLLKRNAANVCIENTGLEYEDIDLVVANDILSSYYYNRIKKKVKKLEIIGHHLAHACSAFYPSDFSEAAILTVDGGGTNIDIGADNEYSTLQVCSLAYGEGNKIKIIDQHIGKRYDTRAFDNKIDPVTDSLGGFYGVVTYTCGFTFHEEGKTMGLAPYGTSIYYRQLLKYTNLGENGKFYFTIEGIKYLLELRKLWESELDTQKKFNIKADIAYSGQKIVEEALIYIAEYLKKITNTDNICIAGGVALNSVANYKLYKQGLFKNFFIQPAAGDNGTSIGSAYYGWYGIMENPRKF